MQCVQVGHDGWADGLLVDHEGRAWRVARSAESGLHLVLTGRDDVMAELRRLLGSWVKDVDEGDGQLEGLDVDHVTTIELPGARVRLSLAQAKAVAVLATVTCGASGHADLGAVMRRLEKGGALLRADAAPPPGR